MTRPALIVGCGYVGVRLGRRLAAEGLEVVGTTRSEDRASELESAGLRPLVGELTDRETLRQIDRLGARAAVYLVPPQRDGPDPLRGVLTALGRAPLEAFVYGSSTGVYGDRDGAWVDEGDRPDPSDPRTEARLAAEREVLRTGWDLQTPTRIARISGIYGPGRTLRRSLERGDYLLIRDLDTWVNRIHVDDLVSALIAACWRGIDGRVYNLVDDAPHRSSEFALLAAELHGLSAPQWVDREEAEARYGPGRLRRKLSNKRVRNRRMREELEVELRYPDYRTGLPAAVKEERAARASEEREPPG